MEEQHEHNEARNRGHKKDLDRTYRDDTKAKPKTTPHRTNSWLEKMSKTNKTKDKTESLYKEARRKTRFKKPQ